jgi:dCMP deaminase
MEELRRPTWDEYFLGIAFLAAKRSTCLIRQVGAVLVKDNTIISTGYNGAASGLDDCRKLGCLRKHIIPGTQQEICRAIHAEQNAIIQAAVQGVSIEGATLYTTHSPCILCARMIINAKIKKCVYSSSYSDLRFQEIFDQAGIAWLQMIG